GPADRQSRRAQARPARRRAGRDLPRTHRGGGRLMLRLKTSDRDFEVKFARIVNDRRESEADTARTVRDILAKVRDQGDDALAEMTARCDGYRLTDEDSWRIGPEACHAAFAALEPRLREALELAAARI